MATYTPTATEIVHYTKADFRRRPIVEAVHIVQYDDSMPILAVELYSDGLVYQAPSTNTFRLRFGHGDGTFSNVESIGTNADRTVVYFRVTPAMTYKFGLRRPVVEMTAGFTFANSSEIPVMIDRNPIQESDEESYSEYTGITQLINGKVDKSAQAAKDSTMTQPVGIDSDGKLWSVPGGGGGTGDHNELTNRDASDQHPMSAITGLSTSLNEKYVKPQNGIPASDLEDGIIPETENATEVELEEVQEAEIPLYTVTIAHAHTATLKNYDTTVLPGSPTSVVLNLPTPIAGNDYLTGVIFKAGASGTSMSFTNNAPSGYSIKWDKIPTWSNGKIYEISYRCLWLPDENEDIIISAKWS